MEIGASLGQWIRQRRKALGLTHKELATRIGCAVITLQKIEGDERRPSTQIARRLAEQLDLPREEQELFIRSARGELAPDRLRTPATALPPWQVAPGPRSNLPVARTPIIGREPELTALSQLLLRDDVGLVTLTGPGGIGKTRLALELATRLRESFVDGVFLVDLAPVGDAALVASMVAQALEVTETAGQALNERLASYLHTKRVLLLIDNFEQVLRASPLLSELLRAAPGLKLLVTSRSVLRLSEERAVPLAPLPVPMQIPGRSALPELDLLQQYAAVALFVRQAQAVKPDFRLTVTNAPTVVAICARLEGLPLAIELAAARSRVLDPETLLERLGSRLALLTGGPRDLPARQQTLRSTIDWSYGLLTADQQRLLAQLATFAGGCTLRAAEAVCGGQQEQEQQTVAPPAILELLEALVDNSLVQQQEGVSGELRFTMLETIREYVLEQLLVRGEAEAHWRRHTAFFLELAETAAPKLMSGERSDWLAQMEAEHDNFRAALAWCQDGTEHSATALRLVGALIWFWYFRGYIAEGRAWLERALAPDDAWDVSPQLAYVLYGAGLMAEIQGDDQAAYIRYQQSEDVARQVGDRRSLALSLAVADRKQLALARFEESLTLARELGDPWLLGFVLRHYGNWMLMQNDTVTASALYQEGLDVANAMGDNWLSAMHQEGLADAATSRAQYELATTLYQEALVCYQDLGDRLGVGYCLTGLATVAATQQQNERALVLYHESLRHFHELGHQPSIDDTLERLAALEIRQKAFDAD